MEAFDFSSEEASVSNTIIDNSKTRLMIADHRKINRYEPVVTGALKKFIWPLNQKLLKLYLPRNFYHVKSGWNIAQLWRLNGCR